MNTTPSALARARDEAKPCDRDIARLLDNRFGDGTVYLPSGGAIGLYHTCIALGFVSTDGFITSKGRRLLTHYTY